MKKAKQFRGELLLAVYALLQTAVLVFLRRAYLLTVYQTAAAYLAISFAGVSLSLLAASVWKDKAYGSLLRDYWLLIWSAFHGIIILGFLTCGTYYLTITQLNIVQAVNIFLGVVLFWLACLITRSCFGAAVLGNAVIGFLGVLNHYLFRFRGAAFRMADLKSARTARNVAVNYDFTPDALMTAAVLDLIVWCLVIRAVCGGERRKPFWNRWSAAVTVMTAAGCLLLPILRFDLIYQRTGVFSKDTYLADLFVDFMGSTAALPRDYSLSAVDEIIASRTENTGSDYQGQNLKPNIVVIMNEAFSDLRILGEFETDAPVLPFWDSIAGNAVRGWANVSVLGGNTANSEYEFLTSDTTGVYDGLSPVPYNSYFNSGDAYPGLVSALRAQGYETTAFHPYLSSGWNRPQTYLAMGFDNMIFLEDLEEELDTLRLYVSDQGDYAFIMEWFEEKRTEAPQFFFNVTMQNHGGYTYDGNDFESSVHLTGEAAGKFPETEQFLSLMKASDEALEGLLAYFEAYEEPVIVVLFGDHQPRLENGFYDYVSGKAYNGWGPEQISRQYKTPFLVWSNCELPDGQAFDGDVSLNYLAPLILRSAGLKLSGYQQFVLDRYEEAPVISGMFMQDGTGALFNRGSAEYLSAVKDYRQLVYNHTADAANRRTDFYEALPQW